MKPLFMSPREDGQGYLWSEILFHTVPGGHWTDPYPSEGKGEASLAPAVKGAVVHQPLLLKSGLQGAPSFSFCSAYDDLLAFQNLLPGVPVPQQVLEWQ